MKSLIMDKKTKVLIAVAALAAAVCVGAVSAYLMDQSARRNTIAVGTNTIELVENYEPPEKIGTGVTTFHKKVEVKNTGNVDCYVRLFCEFSDPVMEEMAEITYGGNRWIKAGTFHENPPKGWIYKSEGPLSGYFYYTEALAPEETAVSFLEQVKITVPEGSSDIRDFEIIVYAESVQAEGAEGYENAWTSLLTTLP